MKTIGIVSLSSGTIGEDFVKHEVEIGTRRLKEMGLNVKFMPNSLKGIKYLKEHPECRADDLIEAYMDKDVAIAIINQFPVYADFGKATIEQYTQACSNILEKTD